jgi:hypothetical protein
VQVWSDVPRDEVCRTRLAVPHHEHVGVHGTEVVDGVEQRLALGLRGHLDREVDDVGRQTLRGDLERGPRARRRLEEQVEDALAPQQRHLLHFPA